MRIYGFMHWGNDIHLWQSPWALNNVGPSGLNIDLKFVIWLLKEREPLAQKWQQMFYRITPSYLNTFHCDRKA